MWQQREELEQRGIEVVAVTFEPPPQAQIFLGKTEADWPLLVDPQRRLYRAYGLQKAGFWDIWGPRTWLVYLRELLRGKVPTPSEGDIWQRGGDLLIDADGIIRFHFVGAGPADRPPLQDIIAAYERSIR
ncbi:hypothetical protein DPPLL_13540 [Desulfofustis limnaeus]|uniref:Redoxin domain-containing protein n=1 Tax=Desulfofustis limnaeus TaxID=2740163 RepID=A0ABM7W7X9_9BACT|nr:hypothetical protein DPPLL_13540 [Desulfofustis limnaeus]